jgi:glycosyltransferase involved in cell wall biosynthesis
MINKNFKLKVLIYGDIGGSGGYYRYCKGLLASKSLPDDMDIWFICSRSFYNRLKPLDANIKIIDHPWIDSKYRLKRYLWHLCVYPRIVRKLKPDVEFYSTGQLRLFLRKALTISTCHNLLLFDKKELEQFQDKNEKRYFTTARKRQIKSFLKSDAVIFLSKHSSEVVSNELPAIKQQTVISHGLDSVFIQPNYKGYAFNNKIEILYVSPIFHYKHQLEVAQAIKMLREWTGLNVVLHLVGGGNSLASIEFKKYIQDENLQDIVRLTEFIETKDLLKMYMSADIFVFASSCETFGITILEAMGAKLPIACSNRTGLSEILKDAGVYFDPTDTYSIAEALKLLVTNENLRLELAEKAYCYALEYTWERCASETFNYIKEIYAKNKAIPVN